MQTQAAKLRTRVPDIRQTPVPVVRTDTMISHVPEKLRGRGDGTRHPKGAPPTRSKPFLRSESEIRSASGVDLKSAAAFVGEILAALRERRHRRDNGKTPR